MTCGQPHPLLGVACTERAEHPRGRHDHDTQVGTFYSWPIRAEEVLKVQPEHAEAVGTNPQPTPPEDS